MTASRWRWPLKLVKQALLYFREGTSDKVYEVDLCEVGLEKYVVNFRYGRRGAQLKDGSKTVASVPLAEAQRVFDQLVASKVAKGYRHGQDSSSSPAAPPAPAPEAGAAGTAAPAGELGPREQAILEQLERRTGSSRATGGIARLIAASLEDEDHPLERTVWRAGELGIRQAEPLLLPLIGRGGVLLTYCTIWALARIGSRAAIPRIKTIYEEGREPALRRVAAEALRLLYDATEREQFTTALQDGLPAELATLARHGTPAAFEQALRRRLEAGEAGVFDVLHTVYLIDSATVRPALLAIVGDLPLRLGGMRAVRGLFKAAELRRDAELFGLIAYRFEKTAANSDTDFVQMHGGTYGARDQRPFGRATRDYLRRRVWRTLRRLGKIGSPDFVRLAVGVLLPFKDGDGGELGTRSYYSYLERRRLERRWDRFAPFWAFNHLLYGRSPRYRPGIRAWKQVSTAAPSGREEPFPELWERAPQALLHLLDESACEPVHCFAVGALSSPRCAEFVASLDLEAIAMLLGRPYPVTAAFGFELARRRYDPHHPDLALLSVVVQCVVAEARAEARRWIDAARALAIGDTGLLCALVVSPHADNREYARGLLRGVFLGEENARVLIVRVIAALHALPVDESAHARAGDASLTLLACFRRQLSQLGLEVIRDLLRSPLAELQALAGDILSEHEFLAHSVPDDILVAMIDSPAESVRGVGLRLLGQLPDHRLLDYRETLMRLSTHEQADLRAGVRPLIARLARTYPDFGAVLVLAMADALIRRGNPEGVPGHLLASIREDLAAQLRLIDEDRVWRLLNSKVPEAQELGGVLLADLPAERLSLEQIVKLASHDILAVREASFSLFKRSRERVEADMATAIRILDARWQDSRSFAMAYVREHFAERHLTPAILVAICDSVREDVRAFGRELITRYFAEEHGQEYLIKLSEHPSVDLQLFASNYLEAYAGGNVPRLRELRHYFVSVLSRVNRARVAKRRCLAFLAAEAERSYEAAEVVAEILGRQSATMAVGDKASMIEAMVRLRQRWGDGIALPLELRDNVRRAGARGDDRGV